MFNSQKLYDSLKALSLSQNILELSNTSNSKMPVDHWSGAVNFIIVEDQVLLIRRSDEMPTHKGQVAFVGGHKEENEKEPQDTAFRELEEEISIDRSHFEFLGLLEGANASSRTKLIIPVVSYCSLTAAELLKRVKSNGEWTDSILIPFLYLENKDNWSQGKYFTGVSVFSIMFCPLISNRYSSSSGDNTIDHMLWGLTAKMIWNFFKIYSDNDKKL